MRKFWGLLSGLRVSTSLVLVLALFFVMLTAGAVLGVGSLYLNNQSFTEVVRNQQARAGLVAAIDSYKDIQITLGRTLASFMVNSDLQHNEIASAWGSAEETTSGLSDQTKTLLNQANTQYDRTLNLFESFTQHLEFIPDEGGSYKQATDAFNTLMSDGVRPMIEMLSNGQVGEYQDYLDSMVVYLEEDLISTLMLIAWNQQQLIDTIHANETDQYKLILIVVVSAIVAALIISILAYLFLRSIVLQPLRRASEHFDRIASGDMTQRVEVTNNNEIGQLYAALRRMQESLTRVVSEVRAGVEEITEGATEIYRGNVDLSSRTEQQAASLQQTAASMEELDGTVRQNTDNAVQADSLAQGASQVAERGGSAVNGVVTIMRDISTSSNQMSEIVNVIDSIAFQTNILALNAAVEAARAGEQGRGFAVVAGEVRALAQRSAQAAREIKQLIDESVVKVGQGATSADEAGGIMQEVVTAIQSVTTIMGEISSASHEQAQGIGQVNLAVTEMDSVVQQNASLVEQATAAAGSLQEQATRLSEAVAFFRLIETEVIDISTQEQQQLVHY